MPRYGSRCGGGFHGLGCHHGYGGGLHMGGYRSGGYRGGGGGYRPRYYSSYTPKAPPSYTPEAMNAVQSAIAKRQAEDATRLQQQVPFGGNLMPPSATGGNINFNPNGQHVTVRTDGAHVSYNIGNNGQVSGIHGTLHDVSGQGHNIIVEPKR